MADKPQTPPSEEKQENLEQNQEKVESTEVEEVKEPKKEDKPEEKTEEAPKEEEHKEEEHKEEEHKQEEPKEEEPPKPKKKPQKVKPSKHTTKETAELIAEIQEVAEDLQDLSIPDVEVEDEEEAPKEEEKPAEVAQVEKPKEEEKKEESKEEAPKEEEPKTEEVEKTEDKPAEEPKSEEKPQEESKDQAESDQQNAETKVTNETPKEPQPEEDSKKENDSDEQPMKEETVEKKESPKDSNPEEKKSKFAFVTNLVNKIKPKKKDPSEAAKTDEKSPKKKKSLVVKILIGVGISLAVILLVLAALAGAIYFASKPVIDNGLKAVTSGKEAYALLDTQNLPEGLTKLTETKEHLMATEEAFKKLNWTKFLPGLSKYQEDGEAALKASVAGTEAGEILLNAVIPYADVLGFSGEGSYEGGSVEDRIAQMVETLEKVTPELEKVSEKLIIVQSEFEKIDPNDYPEQIQGKNIRANILKAKILVHDVTLALTDARPIVEALPSILGHPEGKKYMVIFQNDGELRATGGFMSAFAVLKVDKGRVAPEKSDDIYSLDDKFGRTVEPPEVITKYLNERSWHLRNMNISPDYRESMTTFKEHYDTLDGEFEVDGIVAIDTVVLEELIKVTGPIEVPGFGTFTTENDERCNLPQIVCEIEHIVDKPLATIVTNRKTQILGPLMQEIMKQSLGGGKEKLSELMPLMFRLLEEKHILTYFVDETAQSAAETFNIAGRIKEYDGDYFHVNNQNFGGAKSNFYITDEVEQEIEIMDDGTIKKTVSLTYTHNEPMDNCNLEAGELCLSGIQRNYFKVYVPKGAQLLEGLGSEVEIGNGEDLGKSYFDGFFTLRPESRSKVKLTYTIPADDIVKDGKYHMLIQKQPGTRLAKYKVTVNGKTQEVDLTKDTELEIEL